MRINSSKIKAIILGMCLGASGDNKKCKNEIKLSALNLIDNTDVILDNGYWIKYLPNFEQQRFYDDKYYKSTLEKWNNTININIRDCIVYKEFYLRNIKDKVWYEEAKKVYMDGYLVLPLTRPILPSVKEISRIYDPSYLKDKIAYFSIGDYVRCIEKENEEQCDKNDNLKIVGGTIVEILAIMGLVMTCKNTISCFAKMVNYCFRRSFNTIEREIGFAWGRDLDRLRGNNRVADIEECSDCTVLNDDFELEWIGVEEDDKMSQKSDTTITNDLERETIDLTDFSDEIIDGRSLW